MDINDFKAAEETANKSEVISDPMRKVFSGMSPETRADLDEIVRLAERVHDRRDVAFHLRLVVREWPGKAEVSAIQILPEILALQHLSLELSEITAALENKWDAKALSLPLPLMQSMLERSKDRRDVMAHKFLPDNGLTAPLDVQESEGFKEFEELAKKF